MDIALIVSCGIAQTRTARPKGSFGDAFLRGPGRCFRNIHTPASRPVRRRALVKMFSTAEPSWRRQAIETPADPLHQVWLHIPQIDSLGCFVLRSVGRCE